RSEGAIQKSSRRGGLRQGGSPGADIILRQLAEGTARRRIGLRSKDRTPVRGGSGLYLDEAAQSPIGQVTSGGFGATVNAPGSMGYVGRREAKAGRTLVSEVRGKRIAVAVTELPFVKPEYRRNERPRAENSTSC